MSTQVDDLKIKLEGDIKGAEHELDKLIGKIGELSDKVANIGSKSSGSITKSFASIDLGGAKSKLDKFQSYVDKAASDMAKKLIIDGEPHPLRFAQHLPLPGEGFGENGA